MIFIGRDGPPGRPFQRFGAPGGRALAIEIAPSIAEGNIHVARGLHHLAILRNQLEPIDGFRNRYLTYLIVLVTNHRTKMSFIGQLDGFHAEARA